MTTLKPFSIKQKVVIYSIYEQMTNKQMAKKYGYEDIYDWQYFAEEGIRGTIIACENFFYKRYNEDSYLYLVKIDGQDKAIIITHEGLKLVMPEIGEKVDISNYQKLGNGIYDIYREMNEYFVSQFSTLDYDSNINVEDTVVGKGVYNGASKLAVEVVVIFKNNSYFVVNSKKINIL